MDITSRHKKCLLIHFSLIAFIICFFFSGCDVYSGRRPFDYGAADWVCEGPEIIIHVQPDHSVTFEIEGVEPADTMHLDFSFGGEMVIFDIPAGSGAITLFRGNCSFGSKRMKVLVTQDDLFGGKYVGKAIVFTRVDSDT